MCAIDRTPLINVMAWWRIWNMLLAHWGRVTQAVIWTNDGILLIEHLGTNFSEIVIEIYIFSFKIMHLKLSSSNWQPYCLNLNMLTNDDQYIYACMHLSLAKCLAISAPDDPGGCFTNVSRALQNILSNFVYGRNRTSYANFKLTLYTCAQSHTKFQLEILTINFWHCIFSRDCFGELAKR